MIDIISILSSKEKVNIEAKLAERGIPNSIWDTYSSFANTFGGVILLGVEENKETHELIPKGVNDAQQMISDFWNTMNNPTKISANILLDHHVYKVPYNGMELVAIEVPRADRRDKPVYVGPDMFKGSYKRNHEGDYHCSKEEIKAMLRDQADTPQDALMLETHTLYSLNQDSIRSYRTLFNNLKPDHVWAKLGLEEFLMKIGAAKKSQVDGKVHPTLGGLIFFGDFNIITDELPNYFLDYRERCSSDSRWSDRITSGDGNWSGNIFDFYYKIIDRMLSDVKRPFKLDENLLRVDETPIHTGLRECLANALIHADYYGRQGIVIDKEFRRITISNPGTFRISIDEAIAGGISDARNGKIFNMFSLINVGERSGSGICDVFHVWEQSGLPRPEFVESVEPDRIILTLQTDSVYNHGGNVRNHEGNVHNNEGNAGTAEGNLSDNERLVLSIIQSTPTATAKVIAAKCGISDKTVTRLCKSLKDKGLIKREGNTRGKWIVL